MRNERAEYRDRVKPVRRLPDSTPVFVVDIERFCGGCDQFKTTDATCKIADLVSQVTCVDGKWCGYASVQKARGAMTDIGFQRAPRPASPQTAR